MQCCTNKLKFFNLRLDLKQLIFSLRYVLVQEVREEVSQNLLPYPSFKLTDISKIFQVASPHVIVHLECHIRTSSYYLFLTYSINSTHVLDHPIQRDRHQIYGIFPLATHIDQQIYTQTNRQKPDFRITKRVILAKIQFYKFAPAASTFFFHTYG